MMEFRYGIALVVVMQIGGTRKWQHAQCECSEMGWRRNMYLHWNWEFDSCKIRDRFNQNSLEFRKGCVLRANVCESLTVYESTFIHIVVRIDAFSSWYIMLCSFMMQRNGGEKFNDLDILHAHFFFHRNSLKLFNFFHASRYFLW